jgi:hypothetical protein
MVQIAEKQVRDEAEMRGFYMSLGMSPATIDAAIRVRYSKPVQDVPGKEVKSKKAGRRTRHHPRKR